MEQNQSAMPREAEIAIKLLYVLCVICALWIIIPGCTLMNMNLAIGKFVELSILGLVFILIYMISKGRNWARILFLLILILNLPALVYSALRNLSADPISGLTGAAVTIISITAVVFLFKKPSSEWFRAMKSKK